MPNALVVYAHFDRGAEYAEQILLEHMALSNRVVGVTSPVILAMRCERQWWGVKNGCSPHTESVNFTLLLCLVRFREEFDKVMGFLPFKQNRQWVTQICCLILPLWALLHWYSTRHVFLLLLLLFVSSLTNYHTVKRLSQGPAGRRLSWWPLGQHENLRPTIVTFLCQLPEG